MVTSERWAWNVETHVYLIALDIVGFSRHLNNPNQLFKHRRDFFDAIQATTMFHEAQQKGTVKVHFLGDELRFAFPVTDHQARSVRDFIDNIFTKLKQMNKNALEQSYTRIKGTVLGGTVKWSTWHNCEFLDGELPFKAQRWMSYLQPDEVAVDGSFKQALDGEGVPVGLYSPHKFGNEEGYLLPK